MAMLGSHYKQENINYRLNALAAEGLPKLELLELKEMFEERFGVTETPPLFLRTLKIISLHMALDPENTKRSVFDSMLGFFESKVQEDKSALELFTDCVDYLFAQEEELRAKQKELCTRPVGLESSGDVGGTAKHRWGP